MENNFAIRCINTHLLIWHAYSVFSIRHVIGWLWFRHLKAEFVFVNIHLVETAQAEVKRQAEWIGGKRVLLVLCKAEPTGIQGCKNVSSMKGHSLNLWAKLPGRRSHSALSKFIRASAIVHPSFFIFNNTQPYIFPFPSSLSAHVWRCTLWMLPNYPWTPPAEVVLWEWCKTVTFMKMSVSFHRKQFRPTETHYSWVCLLCGCVSRPYVTIFRRFESFISVGTSPRSPSTETE